jgi:hypothetical protein
VQYNTAWLSLAWRLETGDFDVAGEKRLIEIVLWKLAAEVAQYLGWKDSHVGAAWYEDER